MLRVTALDQIPTCEIKLGAQGAELKEALHVRFTAPGEDG